MTADDRAQDLIERNLRLAEPTEAGYTDTYTDDEGERVTDWVTDA